MPLDGELWLDRKAFQRTVSIVRRQDKSDHWRQIKYVLFDAPGVSGAFEERQKALSELIQQHRPQYAQVLEQVRCTGIEALTGELARVESLGGEGLMLRQPGSQYEAGRSSTLLKVKTSTMPKAASSSICLAKAVMLAGLAPSSWNCPAA